MIYVIFKVIFKLKKQIIINLFQCETTEKDLWFPDPLKLAQCLISKPSIREMGEDEEKIYCGMICKFDLISKQIQSLDKPLGAHLGLVNTNEAQ